MASSSPISCLQCSESNSNPDHFKKGWRLRNGEFALLCPPCFRAYEEERFCETFHSGDDGWRDCESCGKLVHCGCIVSYDAYMHLDFGGIICLECSKKNLILARNRCLALEKQLTGESPYDSMRIDPQNWPQVSCLDLQLISRNSEAPITPLFQKVLSASDTDLNLSRLIIPYKCAEAFFPVLYDSERIPIKIQDTEGKEWEFKYCYRISRGDKIYVLEGLRQIMIDMRWQTGDTVVFYRAEPKGMLVIGLRKGSDFRLSCKEEEA